MKRAKNDKLPQTVLILVISQHIKHADTSGIKLNPGKCINDRMVYPRCVKGKFKYYPVNDDVVDHVIHLYKNQFITISFSNFPTEPEYDVPICKILGLD